MSEETIKRKVQSITKKYKKNKIKTKSKKFLYTKGGYVFGITFLLLCSILVSKILSVGEAIFLFIIYSPFIGVCGTLLDSRKVKDLCDEDLENLKKEYDKEIKELEKKFAKVNILELEKEINNESQKVKKHETEETVEPKKESILPELACEYASYSYSETGLSKEELKKLKSNLLEDMNSSMHETKQEINEPELKNKEEVKVKKYTM